MLAKKRFAEAAMALGDPTRVSIVRALAYGMKSVSDMCRMLNVEMVNLSHHLAVMRNAGVVVSQKAGRHHMYSLVEEWVITATTVTLTVSDGSLSILRTLEGR